jgi:hypothetical protein
VDKVYDEDGCDEDGNGMELEEGSFLELSMSYVPMMQSMKEAVGTLIR